LTSAFRRPEQLLGQTNGEQAQGERGLRRTQIAHSRPRSVRCRKDPKGTQILEYKGKRTTWDEAMDVPDSDPDDPAHTFLFELDDGRVIDATR
jgi:hypothetical protein